MRKRTALVVGASGLVGKNVVDLLLDSDYYDKVTIFVRKYIKKEHDKLEQIIVNFDQLSDYKSHFDINDLYCCLGTTIKKAKTKEKFKHVDLHYPLELAKLAKEQGVSKFLVISAMGANRHSRIFYNQVKGELEERLQQIGLESLHIFRPSLLLGERDEIRVGERIGMFLSKGLNFVMQGPLKSYRAIEGKQVAYAMYRKAVDQQPSGTIIYSSDEIANIH